MPIRAHLKELRTRLLLALAGIGVGAIVGWFLYEPALAYLTAPLDEIDSSIANINFQTIGAAFDLKMRVALWIGLLITSPWWIYQLFAFVSPGLKRRERWHVVIFGLVGVVLFLAGAYSGMRMVPLAVNILLEFTPEDAVTLLRADSYVSFYMKLVTAFGISFLIPEILVVLNFVGVLSAKQMLKGWRWAVIIAFVFAAIANPVPTPWPMTIQALGLIALYLVAVLISWINEKFRAKRRAKEDAKLARELGDADRPASATDTDAGEEPSEQAPSVSQLETTTGAHEQQPASAPEQPRTIRAPWHQATDENEKHVD